MPLLKYLLMPQLRSMGKATLAEALPSPQPEKIAPKDEDTVVDISEVRIIPIRPKDFGLVGFASLVINKAIYLGSIAIMAAPDGVYYLVYPQR